MMRAFANQEVVAFSREILDQGEMGKRGVFDGDFIQQLFGLQAQTIITDSLGIPRMTYEGFSDGGVDLEFNGIKWDVKCVLRNRKPLTSWKCNVSESQLTPVYEAEGYIFVSYDKKSSEFWIVGWITKKELLVKADKHSIGDYVLRDDKTGFVVEEMPFRDIPIRRLKRIYCLDDLKKVGVE